MTPESWFWAEFLVRICATAFVVVFVAWLAARLGPVVGGIVVGLPIVLGPGFFFLLREQPPSFVALTATGALFSLAGTQVFLGAYVAAASKLGPAATTLAAAAGWAAAVVPLALLPQSPWAGAALFAVVTVALRLVCGRLLPPQAGPAAATRWSLLFLRGIAAGLLVGAVTLAASRLSASVAGTLLAFPVGFAVILLSLNLDHGAAIAARTAHAGLVGVTSLAAFCLTLALALEWLPPWTAYLCALAASVAATALAGLATGGRR